jgi:hypothetical protein
MTARFRQGVSDLAGLYDVVLAPETARTVQELGRRGDAPLRFDDVAWCRVVYDFAAAFHRRLAPPDLLLSALVPLYLGRVASFVEEHAASDPARVEAAIESLCTTFRAELPYLRSRWEGASPQREGPP